MTKSVLREPGMPLLVAMTAFGFTGYAALMPVAPLWAAHGGADAGGVGLVNGVLMLATVLTQLMVPAALRRLGWVPVLVGGVTFLGLPTAGFFFSDDLLSILFFSALRGIGFGIITVTGSALTAELVPVMRRGEAIGMYGLAVALPQIVFVSAGAWIVDQFAFEVIFAVGLLPILGVFPAWKLGQRVERVPKPLDPPPYRALVRPMILLLAVTLAGGVLITFMAQMVASSGLVTVALLVMLVTTAFVRWRVGMTADRVGPGKFVLPLVMSTVIGLVLISFAVRDPIDTSVPLLIIGSFFVGVAYGGLQNLTLLLSFGAVDRQHYGAASTTWNVGFDMGTGTGSILIGWIATGSDFSTGLLVAAGISALTIPLALRSRKS
ncbi:MAG: MFS transporter [Flaviflexus sp.]|uniref:MFS transporter n=1 Tax=Flaviflexus sp. TaxID=1969482 RepID=UPI003F92CD97